jgi:hypothetical protein
LIEMGTLSFGEVPSIMSALGGVFTSMISVGLCDSFGTRLVPTLEDPAVGFQGSWSGSNMMPIEKVPQVTLDDPFVQAMNLQYLAARLGRIDVLIQREVRRWQLAGQDPTDAYRGMYISDVDAESLLARPFATSWGQVVGFEHVDQKAYAAAHKKADRAVEQFKQQARSRGFELRLDRLARVFGLTDFEMDAFLICLAPALDLRYERLYGYLQDDVTRRYPGVNLVLDLLCEPGPKRLRMLSHFTDGASLIQYNLLEPVPSTRLDKTTLLGQILRPDNVVIAWLLGDYRPHPELGPSARLTRVDGEQTDQLLAESVIEGVDADALHEAIIAFWGPDQARQQAAARMLAVRTGCPLLNVDLQDAIEDEVQPIRFLRLALRDAQLVGAMLCISSWDVILKDGAPPIALLAKLYTFPGTVIVAGHEDWQSKGVVRDRVILKFAFPIPLYSQRQAMWEHYLGEESSIHELDLKHLAGQFTLTAGQTKDVVSSAIDQAVQRGESLRSEDLFVAARAHSNPRLAGLARKIEPRFDWDDIVLPKDRVDLLHEIVNTVRSRPQVLEGWSVGVKLASSGVTVLFAGEPGTGKTMAAEIIAGELGLDLYKIDLSSVVSKYIGETEKNLERIFDEAATSNAILFFDEADALFGKRSEVKDAHDRYANIEISYLLQRMEAYDGVTILATNLRANLDEAFTRRLQFAVDFPFPGEEDRLRIWQTLFPESVPTDSGIDFPALAARFKFAGGNIRNVIVSAAYLAAADGRRVNMSHLLHGTRRELQKMRRLINESEFLDTRWEGETS